MNSGDPPAEMFVDDLQVSSAVSPSKADKRGYIGAIKLLQSLFPNRLTYTIDSLTAEDDRVAAAVRAEGTLNNGEIYQNNYLLLFTLRDGKIATIVEYFNPIPVAEKIAPLMRAALANPER
jgi:ketosteroid isomerase-like protein